MFKSSMFLLIPTFNTLLKRPGEISQIKMYIVLPEVLVEHFVLRDFILLDKRLFLNKAYNICIFLKIVLE